MLEVVANAPAPLLPWECFTPARGATHLLSGAGPQPAPNLSRRHPLPPAVVGANSTP